MKVKIPVGSGADKGNFCGLIKQADSTRRGVPVNRDAPYIITLFTTQPILGPVTT